MKLSADYYQLAHRIAQAIDIPRVQRIHLPRLVEDAQKADEFGFIFLDDGSAGPFYTSLDNTLPELWARYPQGAALQQSDPLGLIEHFKSDSQVLRSLALGAFNALSQHVMARAGYSPVQAASAKSQPKPGQRVAVIGFIRPLVERLLDKGHAVLVLEKNPGRVELLDGLQLSTEPVDLRRCDFIFCTASTLINDSLGDILQYKQASALLTLVGPSGSGLPDILFDNGVDEVGGILFDDADALNDALHRQESWGHAGQKYQITPAVYPGVDALLASIARQQGDKLV